MLSHPLPIARYRFTAIVQQPLLLPEYAGSLLRGQFGAALRHAACMTRQPRCAGCPLLSTCPYSRIFEAPAPPKGAHALQDFSQIPNPYLIEPPAPGARLLEQGAELVFHMVLIGHALTQLPLIIFAWQRTLERGLTVARVPVELMQVEHVDSDGAKQLVWHHDQPVMQTHDATLRIPVAINDMNSIAAPAQSTGYTGQNGIHIDHIDLLIKTPMRLQHQGQPLRVGQLTARTLLAALVRRCVLLLEFHGGLGSADHQDDWNMAAKTAIHLGHSLRDVQYLHWYDWERYSSRQQQRMTLGGVLGRWNLQFDDGATLAALWPWLWLGQWLHVGKNATMGLGGYMLERHVNA